MRQFAVIAGLLLLGSVPVHGQAEGSQAARLRAIATSKPACAVPVVDTLRNAIHLPAIPLGDPNWPEGFCFTAAGATYGVASDGAALRIQPDGATHVFRLRMDKDLGLEKLYYHAAGDRLYFLYEGSSGGEGASYLDALRDSDLGPIWPAAMVLSFNLGPVLLADSVAYATGVGLVTRINLVDGSCAWRHQLYYEDMKGEPHFNMFRLPVVEGGRVRFAERDEPGRTIVVDDATGALLSPARWRHHAPDCAQPGKG